MTRNGQTVICILAVLWASQAPCLAAPPSGQASAPEDGTTDDLRRTYPIVDTGQRHVFSDRGQLRRAPKPGERFFGQDGCYLGLAPRYRDNGDGTVTDLNTRLTWLAGPHTGKKLTFAEALRAPRACRVGGHDDWRLPSIKELYSLIDFNGNCKRRAPVAYIDRRYFDFRFGADDRAERLIDSQYWSATQYLGRTMGGQATVFGVNFADGRIKGYPRDRGRAGRPMRQYVLLVRGNPAYGHNRFVDNGDGTVSDLATGLMWARDDSPKPMCWQDALAWCERLLCAGHDDWRLPNAKELQSIVDYTRAPEARDRRRRGPAIDPLFRMADAKGWAWSSTTHLDGPGGGGRAAVYVAFGRAMGNMHGRWMDVHGAGAQRSDPKSGDPNDPRWSRGLGPQGDEIRILNYARAVRNIDPDDVKIARPDLSRLDVARQPTQRHDRHSPRRTRPLR